MTAKYDTPKTVGEFIELLERYPKDAELSFQITEIYDNGSVYPTSSDRVAVDVSDWEEESNYVELTFANGRTFPNL